MPSRFHKRRMFVVAVFAALALLALIVITAFYPALYRAKPMNYASAIVTVRVRAPARSVKTTLDAASANRLATFFPQLGTRKKSGTAGAWMPKVEVDFKAADGAVTHVTSNFEVWSEGRGDWPVQPGLEAYVFSMTRDGER